MRCHLLTLGVYLILNIILTSPVSNAETVSKSVRAAVGDLCNPSSIPDECADPNSVCKPNASAPPLGTCGCEDGYESGIPAFKICYATRIGLPCETSSSPSQCNRLPETECVPYNTTTPTLACKCIDGKFPSEDKKSCLYEQCSTDAECKDFSPVSICKPQPGSYNKCECSDDYDTVEETNTCRARVLGQICDRNECDNLINTECRVSTSPTVKTCQCTDDFFENDKTCVENPKRLGEPCNNASQCAIIPYSNCSGHVAPAMGFCDCIDKYEESSSNDMCLATTIDLSCTEHAQCQGLLGSDGFCDGVMKTCACDPAKSVPSLANDKCLPKAGIIGGSCEEPNQCMDLDGAVCVGADGAKKCSCNVDHFPSENNKQCHPPPSLIDEPCESTAQCETIASGFTTCVINAGNIRVGACQCGEGYQASDDKGICQAQAVFADCVNDGQCTPLLGATSFCDFGDIKGRCTCKPLVSTPSSDREKCLLLATSVHDACTEDSQCIQLGDSISTACLPKDDGSGDKTCQCQDGSVESALNNKCLRKQVHGGACEEPNQCSDIGNATCMADTDGASKCLCINTHTEVNNKCYQIQYNIGVGADCIYNQTCAAGLGPSSYCKPSSDNSLIFCDCAYDAKYLPSTKRCHLTFGLNQTCTEDGQCMVGVNPLAYCNNRTSVATCQCRSGIIHHLDSCYEPKTIGDDCQAQTNDESCAVSVQESVCDPITSKCACKQGFTPAVGNTVCSGADFSVPNLSILILTAMTFLSKFSS